jgi:site-specific DNA-methyltransferase (adenine-specific)
MKDVEKRFYTYAKNNHPTVKPIELMEYLIKMVSKENDLILDPFLGSGTTALTCKRINRRFIGIEINNDYVEIAKNRIKTIPDRLELFC